MPLTQCRHCRRVQIIKREMIGQEIGCLNCHCDNSFIAREYRRHSNLLSQLVFYGVIGFALYLAATWWGSIYVNHVKQIIRCII